MLSPCEKNRITKKRYHLIDDVSTLPEEEQEKFLFAVEA